MAIGLVARYARWAFAYGAAHSVANLWDREGLYVYGPRQLLVADKLALGVMLTGSAPLTWPSLAHHDLRVLECAAHGRSPVADYGVRHPLMI